jgi:hypothetical protein
MTTEIINKNGKNYAVIPYDFYQQLVEDAEMLADIKAYDIAKNKSEESFPSDIVNRIFLEGENPIKVYREYRGFSLLELSEKTQIDIQRLTEIEQNISTANKKNIETIANILNIDVNMII